MIVDSAIAEDSRQADGRRWITERHTDQLGLVYEFNYQADADMDVEAVMAERVPALNAQLTFAEILRNINEVGQHGADAGLTFNYSTQAQNILAMAQQVDSLTPWQRVLLAEFLANLPDEILEQQIGLPADGVALLRQSVAGVVGAVNGLSQVITVIASGVPQGT